MHLWSSLFSLLFLLSSTATPVSANTCLFYKTKKECVRYTDSGSCIWSAQAEACLDGGLGLPPGTVGVAIVGLDPQSAPLELKPGPSVSYGNVSLKNSTEITVKFAEQKSLNIADGPREKRQPSEQEIVKNSLKAVEVPTAEINTFCLLPPVMGRCRGFFQRWYYDVDAQQCLEFSFGGCGGNANNFATRQECEFAAEQYC